MRRLLPALTIVLALAGCSGSPSDTPTAPRPSAHSTVAEPGARPVFDATVRTASCTDWQEASAAKKRRLVTGMHAFFSGQVSRTQRGQALTAPHARKLFNSYCDQSFAGAFQLYRIYGNAAGFAPPTKQDD